MRARRSGLGPGCGSSSTTRFLLRAKGLERIATAPRFPEYRSPVLSYQRRVDAHISLTLSPVLAIFLSEVLVVAVNFFHSREKNIHSNPKIFASIKTDQA